MAAKPSHRRRSLVEIGVDERAPILGVKLRSHACGPDEVTEHDGDRTTLGGRRRRCRRGARRLGGGFLGPESGDRLEETLAVPQRHPDLFEVGFDQVAEDARVDLMLAEHGFVLSEVDRVQPLGDVHRRSRTRFTLMMVPGRLRVQAGSVGRPLWGRLDPFARCQGMAAICVRREKAALSSGCKSHPANAPAGSNRSSHGGDEMAEAFGVAGHV